MDSQLSKSEKKRRAKGIEQLVAELAVLPLREIASLPCDQEIREVIAAAKELKGGSRKRQLKFATKLLRDKPADELYDFLARKKGSILKEKREFRELEHFRNTLITEAVQRYEERVHDNGYVNEFEPPKFLKDSMIIRDIVNHLPEVDLVSLKNAAIQFARTRNRKFSREVFRIMKAAMEKTHFSQQEDKNNGI
jgi:ribosome-associated protein